MIGVLFSDGIPSAGGSMTLPQVFSVSVEFAPAAMIALGAPLLILVVGVGNIQSLAILRSEGFDMKGNLMGLTAGCVTLINAMFGGHAASIGGAGTPLGAGSSAGVKEFRFWAIIISSVPVVLIAFAATPIIALIQELPVSYTLTVGALALVAPFKQVLLKSLAGSGKAGALTAIVAATIPVQLAGMPMAFWALVAGVVVTMLASQKVVGCLHRVRTFVVPGYARA
jgi:predicted benzoate:H+ symporter BenE